MSVGTSAPFQSRVPRDLVVVDGPDATSFLQSLVSQDLDPIAVGESAHSLLLAPQGKLIVDFYALHRAADSWWCVCEGGFGSVLAEGLNRFKIRVKAEITTPPVAGLALRGVVAPEASEVAILPVAWSGDAFDAIGSEAEIAALSAAVDAPLVDAAAYERARIEAGVPRLGHDVDERTIPQEAFLELDAVSFTKGCFVGQELVCRIDTRGHVNRMLRRVRAADPLTVGTELVAGGKAVGAVTSAAGEIGLAMIRREIDAGTTVDAAGKPVTVEAI